jgi:hypothetical protein
MTVNRLYRLDSRGVWHWRRQRTEPSGRRTSIFEEGFVALPSAPPPAKTVVCRF